MRKFDTFRTNVFSQEGEDGLLDEIFKRINPKEKSFCEFGAADGIFCSNTRLLLENGWSGKLIEADPARAKGLIDNTLGKPVELYFGAVTPENVNTLVPHTLNLLSIDVDGIDYLLWDAYTGTADVVVIEINSSVPYYQSLPIGHPQHGTCYKQMVRLGILKGYFLLAHKGNCIFILNKYRKLFPEIEGDGLENADLYFDRSWL